MTFAVDDYYTFFSCLTDERNIDCIFQLLIFNCDKFTFFQYIVLPLEVVHCFFVTTLDSNVSS